MDWNFIYVEIALNYMLSVACIKSIHLNMDIEKTENFNYIICYFKKI